MDQHDDLEACVRSVQTSVCLGCREDGIRGKAKAECRAKKMKKMYRRSERGMTTLDLLRFVVKCCREGSDVMLVDTL